MPESWPHRALLSAQGIEEAQLESVVGQEGAQQQSSLTSMNEDASRGVLQASPGGAAGGVNDEDDEMRDLGHDDEATTVMRGG